jgi:hypothetical protein
MMRRFLLSAVLLLIALTGFSTEYYSQGSGNGNSPAIWNSARNGSGAAPVNFSTEGDVFIIQSGHVITTNNTWSLSGILRIEGGGRLEASHAVSASEFEIISGGYYRHNFAGAGLLGVENYVYSINSTVEIANWTNASTPIPNRNWGNLILSFQHNSDWDLNGNLRQVNGNLVLRNTGSGATVFSNSTPVNINITGNFIIESGTVKPQGSSNIVSVHIGGNLELSSSGKLDITGSGFLEPIEFNVGQNFINQGEIVGENIGSIITLKGSANTLFSTGILNAGLRIAPGASLTTLTALEMESDNILVVSGALNTSFYSLNINNSYLVVAGGTLRSSRNIYAGNTAICTGDGNPVMVSTYGYCGISGNAGAIILEGGKIILESGSSGLAIGEGTSSGNMFMTDFAEVETGLGAEVIVAQGSKLSMDQGSVILGSGRFRNQGGYMVVGSPDGIRLVGGVGNIQVSGDRSYSSSGIYEYVSTEGQVTGNGLPSEITGKVIINHSGNEGVYLSAPLTIKSGGSFELQAGVLFIEGMASLTFEDNTQFIGGGPNAYINGAITKVGTSNFTFHVGRDNIYSPVVMTEISGANENDRYRVSYFPVKATTMFFGIVHPEELHHISDKDTWLIEQLSGDVNAEKSFTVTYNERSGVDNPASLTIAYRDFDTYKRLPNTVVNGSATAGTVTFTPLLYGPFTLASVDLMNPLPVVLSHFTAEKSSGKSLLKWNITPESNADYIEILHRGNTGEFMVIGIVNAAENPKDYLFIHNNPIAGDNYYQLKITDKEGVITYSKVEKLHFEIPGNKIALYPSVGTTTRLHVASEDSKMMKVRVMGQNGQLIKGFEIRVEKGNNSFVIDMNNLPSGVYLIGVYDGNRLTGTERFLRK